VRADARSTHQSVVTAMDVLGKLGFVRINIATVEDSKPRNESADMSPGRISHGGDEPGKVYRRLLSYAWPFAALS
jgi:hypothetical protein